MDVAVLDTIDAPVTAARSDVLSQRMDQLEETQEESSRRLHLEIDDVRRRIEALSVTQAETGAKLTRLDATPVDAEKIRFSPKVVATIGAICLSMAGAVYASSYGIRGDVQNLSQVLETQRQLAVEKEKLEAEKQKLSDERLQSIRNAVDMLDKRQQLAAIETQELKEMVLRQGR